MKDHHIMWRNAYDSVRQGEPWALSVACAPSIVAADLAEAELGGRYYCASDVGKIRDAGFDVVPDGAPHSLLLLGDTPDPLPNGWEENRQLWQEVRALFHGPYDNPGYAGRKK